MSVDTVIGLLTAVLAVAGIIYSTSRKMSAIEHATDRVGDKVNGVRDSVERLDKTVDKVADKLEKVAGQVEEHGRQIVRIETKMNGGEAP